MKLKEFIFFRLKYLGLAPICNLRADRAPKFFGYSFILCWRCTGALIGSIFCFLLRTKLFNLENILLALLFILSFVFDCILQYYFNVESNNYRRFITGFLLIFGINMLLFHFKYINLLYLSFVIL